MVLYYYVRTYVTVHYPPLVARIRYYTVERGGSHKTKIQIIETHAAINPHKHNKSANHLQKITSQFNKCMQTCARGLHIHCTYSVNGMGYILL